MRIALVVATAAAVVLSGCANMSGLDAQSNFSCKAPPGVSCQSISGVYSNSLQDNLPFQQQRRNGGAEAAKGSEEKPAARTVAPAEKSAKLSPRDMDAMNSGMPIRQPPLVLRVWVAPYEDDAGDLHDQAFFYTMVHSGKWMIEANRTKIANQFRPVFPLKQKQASDDSREVQPAGAQMQASPLAGDKPQSDQQ